jgi:hypothetical protein
MLVSQLIQKVLDEFKIIFSSIGIEQLIIPKFKNNTKVLQIIDHIRLWYEMLQKE